MMKQVICHCCSVRFSTPVYMKFIGKDLKVCPNCGCDINLVYEGTLSFLNSYIVKLSLLIIFLVTVVFIIPYLNKYSFELNKVFSLIFTIPVLVVIYYIRSKRKFQFKCKEK